MQVTIYIEEIARSSMFRTFRKSPFTRQKKRAQTRGENGTDRKILAVFLDNNLQQVRQKVGQVLSLEGCVYTTHFGVRTCFLCELEYGTAHAIGKIVT